MKLNAHDRIGLRRLADDAQRDGKFDDAETLNELLDAIDERDEQADKVVELEDKIDDLEAELDDLAKALGDALGLAAEEIDAESDNIDDVQISIGAEIDRLREIVLDNKPGQGCDGSKIAEVVVNLVDVVSTLRGQRARLIDSAKRAREALSEVGR